MPERVKQAEPSTGHVEFRHLTADDFETWEERLTSAYGDLDLEPEWRRKESKSHLDNTFLLRLLPEARVGTLLGLRRA